MENTLILSSQITFPNNQPISSISSIISLTNNRIWIYFYSGLSQYWDLNVSTTAKLISSTKISPDLYHVFAVSNDKIAFYDHHIQKLQVLCLENNQIDPNFYFSLPTSNAIREEDRYNDDKILEICRDYTKFCALTTSQMIVVIEKNFTSSKTYDSILSIYKESTCPEPFKQTINQISNYSIANLNTENTIILYNVAPELVHIFYVWNVLLGEEFMRKIVIKNDLCCAVIKVTSYGIGKFALWINAINSGTPEIAIVEYENEKKKEEKLVNTVMERIPINCYEDDWLLSNVILYDLNKEIALLEKSGDFLSLELINMKNLKPVFSQVLSEEKGMLSQSVSLDLKYYMEYLNLGGDCIDDDNEEEEKGMSEEFKTKIIFNKLNY